MWVGTGSHQQESGNRVPRHAEGFEFNPRGIGIFGEFVFQNDHPHDLEGGLEGQ